MNKKALYTLEYNKITERLTQFADSPPAKELCSRILPLDNIDRIQSELDKTGDALSRIFKKGRPSFLGTRNITGELKRLGAQASLSCTELLNLADILEVSSRVKGHFEETHDSLTSYFDLLDCVPPLLNEIRRCIVSPEEISDDASDELRSIRKQKAGFRDKIQSALFAILNSSQREYLQEPIVTMRGDRYCLPVRAGNRSKIPGILHDKSSTGSTLFIEPQSVVSLNNDLRELELQEKKEIERILASLSAFCSEHSDTLYRDSKTLISLDFYFAKADFARKMKATMPVLNTENRIDLKKARHPLIDPSAVVPVDFSIGEKYRLLIITGPNTGGKTVTLKTAGLLTLMAQAGLFIPAADNSHVAVFREVYADIGDEQSIEQSLSTFSSHMTNIADIVKKASSDCLLLFDEIGAGTDPTEGAALAISILNSLKDRGITTVATTHYSELKVYALSTDDVENAGCEFDIDTLRPTYHLLIGIPGKSNAFAISKKLGLPEDLIADAAGRLNENDAKFEDLISDLDSARRTALREKEEISEYKELIERQKQEIEKLKEKAAISREKILNNANEEAARILNNARQTADKAVKTMNKKGVTLQELEEQRRKLREASENRQEKIVVSVPKRKPRRQSLPKDFLPGVKVHVLSMDVDGEVVVAPDDKGEALIAMGSFKTRIHISELEITGGVPKPEPAPHTKASGLGMSKTATVSTEINLLGKTVDEAVAALDKYMDDACLSGLKRVRIIHGKGTGALRKGIRSYLKILPYVKNISTADAGEGGDGATIVEM